MSQQSFRVAGFTLLPVILTMSLIVAIAFLLNRDNGMNVNMVSSQMHADRARYAAEAGLQAVNARVQSFSCAGGFPVIGSPVTNSNFGGASYSAYATTASGNTTNLVSTGTYNGTSVTLTRNNIYVYQSPTKTYTLQPNATAGMDTYITTNSATNRGNSSSLNMSSTNFPLIKFDLSVFPAGSRPVSSTLSLYANGGFLAFTQLYRMTGDWQEGTGTSSPVDGANWTTSNGSTPWSTAGGDYHPVIVNTVYGTPGNWLDFDATDLTTGWMSGSYPNYGMRFTPSTSIGSLNFVSSDDSDAVHRPKISFNYLLPCGTTGPSVCTAGNIRDDFSTIAYSGNNGSATWTNNWTEAGESDGPTTGKLSVLSATQCASGNCLKLRNDSATVMRITREANLATAVSARLKFSYRRTMVAGSGGNIRLEISRDGGTNFTLLKSYPLTVTDSAQIAEDIDITPYLAANTQIRFSTDGSNIQTNIHIDNVEIITSCAAVPGATVTLSPIADSFNDQDKVQENNGAATSLLLGYDYGKERRMLIQFDTSSVPSGSTIQSATLRMYVSAVNNATSNSKFLGANALNESWVEGTGNGTNKNCPGTITPGTSWNYRTGCTNWAFIHPPNTTPAWTTVVAMPTARAYHMVATVNNKIYAIGGYSPITGYLGVVEEYNPATNTWTAKAAMPTPRGDAAVAVVGGRIYIIGGSNGGAGLTSNEVYDPATNTWTTRAAMPTGRMYLAAAAANNKIYVLGGTINGTALKTNEEYDPATNTWATKTQMPTARTWFSAQAANGRVYAIGGWSGSASLNKTEEYNPSANTWSGKANLPVATDSMASAVIGNKIYLISGYQGSTLTQLVWMYDALNNAYTAQLNYPMALNEPAAAAVNGYIYSMGGGDGGSVVYQNHYRYDPGLPQPVATASDEATSASPLVAGFSSGWINFELKTLAQEWVDGVRPNNGVVIYTEVADKFSINSRENSANKPQLIVTY